MSKSPPLRIGQIVTLEEPDTRLLVRLACVLRRSPVPKVLRDYLVVRSANGGIELRRILFGDG